jgi:hypothetical protein
MPNWRKLILSAGIHPKCFWLVSLFITVWEMGTSLVAKKLVEWNPKELGFFVELAYATSAGIDSHAILTRAASLHPNDATIQFNLPATKRKWAVPGRSPSKAERPDQPSSG